MGATFIFEKLTKAKDMQPYTLAYKTGFQRLTFEYLPD